MLDRDHRLTSSAAFATTTRRGRRAGARTLVLHLATRADVPSAAAAGSTGDSSAEQPRVGFVVSKAVGNAVTRNRVQRRLRHLVAERLGALPPRSLVVVRALPSAASSTYRGLGRDLDTALTRLGLGPHDGQDGTVTAR